MPRHPLTPATLLTGLVALALAGPARAQSPNPAPEDPRTAAQFIKGLRDKGYLDLAGEALERVVKQPDAPPELVATADFEIGKMYLDEASKTGDLERRRSLLDDARTRLEAFTRARPDHPRAPEAFIELARILVERGHIAVTRAEETEVAAEKDSAFAEARTTFDLARAAYETAEKRLQASFDRYPKFIPADDPRKAEKEDVHNALMQSQLQKAIVEYEQGETYPAGSKERAQYLSKGLEQFETLYKRYRTNMAGLAARMWQGKCFEEQGELGKAMGIYNELMEHAAPQLRPLQRYVGYFRIIVLGKRKEFALAADEAVRWLQSNPGNDAQRSKEGLGVQLELAKNLIAQLPSASGDNERIAATKRATDVLGQVVRYTSPYKAEALELLKKYKPRAAANALDVARLNYEDALGQGEQALAAHEFERAEPYLRQAVRKAEALKDPDKTNAARFNLAFCNYSQKRFYEAAVLAEHIARRYPQNGLAARASTLAMASFADAYNTYTKVDRSADLNHLIDLARYTSDTFPDTDQADEARLTLGQIYHGTGKYADAVASYESVRPKSSKYLDARTRAGASHWEQSQAFRRAGKAKEADDAQAKAVDTLASSLKAREAANIPPTDPAYLANACDLADVYLDSSKPEDALKLLEPLAARQGPNPNGAAFNRLTADLLRAHVGVNQVDRAMADMAALEKAGGSGPGLTQLYFGLGKLLEKEMDALKKKGDGARLNATRSAYQKFLSALVASKSGQTYESLQWAGEQMLKLNNPKEAEQAFALNLKTYEADPKFLALPSANDLLLRTRLSLVAALRGERKFGEAESLLSQISSEKPRALEPMVERGYLLEDMAAAGKSPWPLAFKHWQGLALRLQNARTKPVEYYDAWYHAALALQKEGKPKEAKQTLASVMRLSAGVGGPEMKQKYKALIDQIK